jgi:hypothetical protein
MAGLIDKVLPRVELSPAAGGEGDARQEAIRQIERRRRFWVHATVGTILMVLVTVVWATSEYHDAGGWPTQGFSQSSGIHDVWNSWIVYPLIVWVLAIGGHAWYVFGRKPITESEIRQEMERQAGGADPRGDGGL